MQTRGVGSIRIGVVRYTHSSVVRASHRVLACCGAVRGSDMPTTVIVESLRLDLIPGELLRLSGELDTESARAVVRERLERLHEVIPHHEHRAFRVDLRGLTFVNSASIRLFVD